MTIAVYGAGYVGLVSAVCFAKLGNRVICVDVNEARISKLKEGHSPIHEEGLEPLLQEQLSCGNLSFTSNIVSACVEANVHFIATGTPSLADGSADLSQVFSVVHALLEHTTTNGIIVVKSTVPLGTGDRIEARVQEHLASLNKTHSLDVLSNPEFLREGSAVNDFLLATRIIVGGKREAVAKLQKLYQPLIEKGTAFVSMSRVSAELSKYSANAMLACKISFINQISQLAEKVQANIDDIRQGIALDERIGPHFLHAGIGYGGSCFPKDVRALVQTAKELGVDVPLLEAIDDVNEGQKNWIFTAINRHFKQNIRGLTIGFWGLAFKPGTDDVREASSLVALNALLAAGANIRVYDPVVNATKLYPETASIRSCGSAEEVIDVAVDALVIATEWPQFKAFPLDHLQKALAKAPIFDGRNCFDLSNINKTQVTYYSVGRPPTEPIRTATVREA